MASPTIVPASASASRPANGDPRITTRLKTIAVARLAKLAGIKAQIGYKRRPGTNGGKPSVVVDNTLTWQFEVGAPDRAWVTDITYIRTM